jgi:hypothetical protein
MKDGRGLNLTALDVFSQKEYEKKGDRLLFLIPIKFFIFASPVA